MDKNYLSKPAWLAQRSYEALIERQPQECVDCRTREDLTVDHVVSRHEGGTDEVSNLCIRCRRHNSSKGTSPDYRWDRPLFFDAKIELGQLRSAQKLGAWDRMLELAAWFTQPFSQISRRLYTLAWIVGSGKTLAIPTLAFALNWIIRRERGEAAPRTRRVLVLCKERAIREQLATDLKDDLTAYGIAAAPPRVATLEDSRHLGNPRVFENADIWVGCLQLLWEKEGPGARPVPQTAEFLALFDVIVFDEPHYAMEQVLRLVDIAETSLCFGMTSTPIDATGDALRPFVLFSVYGYQEAVENDGSLKYLSLESQEWGDLVEEIGINDADLAMGGVWRKVQDTTESRDYAENARPATTVAERVVQYLHDCDQMEIGGMFAERAPHRDDSDRPEQFYPVHAMLWTDSIDRGETLVEHVNKLLERERARFPRKRGHAVEIVYAPSEERHGKPLDPRVHPWFQYQRTGVLDERCSRIIVVVGIGREGVNNIYCGCIGVAAEGRSMIEAVQRWWGRQIRAVVAMLIEEGVRLVPPRRLDIPKVITHRAFENGPLLHRSLEFLADMASAFEGMVTMDELMAGVDPGTALEPPETGVPYVDRVRITAEIGRARIDEVEPDVEGIVDIYGGENEGRRGKVREFIEVVQSDPGQTWDRLHLIHKVDRREAVMQEWPDTEPTDADLRQFMERNNPDLTEYLRRMEETRPLMARLYQRHAEQFYLGDIPSSTDIDRLRKACAGKIIAVLSPYVVGALDEWRRQVYSLVATAVKQAIDTQQPVTKGGEYDCAQYHVLLSRPLVQQEIKGFVHAALIRQGWLPAFEVLFSDLMARMESIPNDEATEGRGDL